MGAKQRPPTCTLIAKMIVSNREFLNKTRHWRFYKLGIHSIPQEPDLKVLDTFICPLPPPSGYTRHADAKVDTQRLNAGIYWTPWDSVPRTLPKPS